MQPTSSEGRSATGVSWNATVSCSGMETWILKHMDIIWIIYGYMDIEWYWVKYLHLLHLKIANSAFRTQVSAIFPARPLQASAIGKGDGIFTSFGCLPSLPFFSSRTSPRNTNVTIDLSIPQMFQATVPLEAFGHEESHESPWSWVIPSSCKSPGVVK